MSQTTNTNRVSYFFTLLKQAIKGGEHDYTAGSIRKAIFLLAVPMILELSLESVFALVDMYFVGHLPNSQDAVQTVGLTEAVISIVYSIAIGLSTAATAMVSRRIGEKNPDAAAHAGMQSIIISILITILISIPGVIYASDILRIMGAEPETIAAGTSFTQIMLGGSIVIILLFLINGIFRGAGDAAMAMRSLWIASIINIILCPLFIYGIGSWEGWGLKGAAIATTIGRGTGVIYQCIHLFKGSSIVHFTKRHLRVQLDLIRSFFVIAWPATFQFLIASGSWIVLTWIIAKSGGKAASSGYQVAIRNVVFFILPAWGLSNAAAALVGQNLGAKEPGRAEKSVLLTARYNAIFMASVSVIFIVLAEPIIRFFTPDVEVHDIGALALRIIGAGYIFYGIGMVMIQALNGSGDTRTPTWINFVCFWLFQIPLAYILANTFNLGPTGAFIAIPAAETVIAIWAFIIFKRGKWKTVKV